MKISVIMPTVDWPIGSGLPHQFFKKSICSVLAAGHDDFQLLIGGDGTLPAVRAAAESFADHRIRYIDFPRTRNFGNNQRHELMKTLVEGELFGFMDHDDAYVPGALKIMHDDCVAAGVPIVFGATLPLCWAQQDGNLRDLALGIQAQRIATQAMISPVMDGMPLWPNVEAFDADFTYAQHVTSWCNERGTPAMRSTFITTLIRPWLRKPSR